MDFKGQVVLSAILVLVGMMFLVPVGTEKALASIDAVAKGGCIESLIHPMKSHPCYFTFMNRYLKPVGPPPSEFTTAPNSGTVVTWSTTGNGGHSEEGWVQYNVEGLGPVKLHFDNPALGQNSCRIEAPPTPGLIRNCHAGSGFHAKFTYHLTAFAKK
jgi:hypothetical protein